MVTNIRDCEKFQRAADDYQREIDALSAADTTSADTKSADTSAPSDAIAAKSEPDTAAPSDAIAASNDGDAIWPRVSLRTCARREGPNVRGEPRIRDRALRSR